MPTEALQKKSLNTIFFEKNMNLAKVVKTHNKHVSFFNSNKGVDASTVEEMVNHNKDMFYVQNGTLVAMCLTLQEQLENVSKEIHNSEELKLKKDSYWKNFFEQPTAPLILLGIPGLIAGAVFLGVSFPFGTAFVAPIIFLAIGIIALTITLISAYVSKRDAKVKYECSFPVVEGTNESDYSYFTRQKEELEQQIAAIEVPDPAIPSFS